jgi:hypothetical protein
MHRIEALFQAEEGAPEADEVEILVTLIEAYEIKRYPIGPADPVEAIRVRMELLAMPIEGAQTLTASFPGRPEGRMTSSRRPASEPVVTKIRGKYGAQGSEFASR